MVVGGGLSEIGRIGVVERVAVRLLPNLLWSLLRSRVDELEWLWRRIHVSWTRLPLFLFTVGDWYILACCQHENGNVTI